MKRRRKTRKKRMVANGHPGNHLTKKQKKEKELKAIKHQEKLYRHIRAGEWYGVEPIEVSDGSPIHRWDGKKISAEQWREVLAFFLWTMEETKSEAMVTLYYHETHGWAVLALPQKGYTGMTVSAIQDHPGIKEAEMKLPGVWNGTDPWQESFNEGSKWERKGTVHHHCKSAAFQSGTDHSDEMSKEGLHITIGNLDDAKFSIHARASFRGIMTHVDFSDWFDLDPTLAALVPASMHTQLLAHKLVDPPTDKAFPEWWKANVIRQTYAASTGQHYAGHSYPGHGFGYGSINTRSYGEHKNGIRISSDDWDKARFERILKEFMEEQKLTATDVFEIVEGVLDAAEPMDDLSKIVDIMATCETVTKDALEIIGKLARLEELEELEEEEYLKLEAAEAKDRAMSVQEEKNEIAKLSEEEREFYGMMD